MKCKACKYFFAENNYCKKFFIILQKNEVPHNECFERKTLIKNPLRWLKQPHTTKE